MNYLVTGGAGFIGSHVCEQLLKRCAKVICVDNFNDYYSPSKKWLNVSKLLEDDYFTLYEDDICDYDAMRKIFEKHKIDKVIHLAARAGVRASITDPILYEEVNLLGTTNLLELSNEFKIKNFVFASSSSVYGSNKKMPFKETDYVDTPLSPYAATKKAGELLCHAYHYLYGLNISCLRFFTVYGPRGRPDMVMYKFIEKTIRGEKIDKFGKGNSMRDYTYVSDIVDGILAAVDKNYPFEIFNLGNSKPTKLNKIIKIVEKVTGKKVLINQLPKQKGDVDATYADISKAKKLLGYKPKVSIEDGIQNLYDWYSDYNAFGYDISFFNNFWYFKILKKCPRCKIKMIEKGYPKLDGKQYYKCLKCGLGDI